MLEYKIVVQVKCMLSEEKTYSQARQNLASTLDDVVDNNTVIVIKRRSGKDVALIS